MTTIPRHPGQDDDGGPLVALQSIADGCCTARPATTWDDACRDYSRLNGGQWHPKPHGLTWLQGRSVVWVMEPQFLRSVVQAREVAHGLGVACGWSIGSASRALLMHIGEREPMNLTYDHMFADAGIGLRVCRPGNYPEATCWDASAYYYTLFSRLRGLRCVPKTDGRITWLAEHRDERARRLAVTEAIGTDKALRNAVWGSMVGSREWRHYWHRGKRTPCPPFRGPFRTAGLVLARTAWELCRDAAEEVESVYTHTDCVTGLGGLYPSVWDRNGIAVRVKATGSAHINSMASFSIGGSPSKLYSSTDCYREEIIVPDAPRVRYGLGWAYRRVG